MPCQLFTATSSRLLIDCNRSLHNHRCFSTITNNLLNHTKQQIIHEYYLPYRTNIQKYINHCIENKYTVLHLSIHSFTPELNKKIRQADLGFLYNPQRHNEKILAKFWKNKLKKQMPEMRIRLNYPYKGTSDGLTTFIRKNFDYTRYIGLEIEINQKIISSQLFLLFKNNLYYIIKQIFNSSDLQLFLPEMPRKKHKQ